MSARMDRAGHHGDREARKRRRGLLSTLLTTGLTLLLAWPLISTAQRPSTTTPAKPAASAPANPLALREQEINSCLPGEQSTWGDGKDRPAPMRPLRFIYRHDGAPAWFSPEQVLQLAQRAAQAWSPCLPATVTALPRGQVPPDDVIQILWSDTGARGQFGLANVPARSLSLGPGLFVLLNQRNPRYPAEQTLQMVLSHEMGHFYGMMAHSRRCVDVMSYYDDGKGQRCTLRDASAWGSVIEYRSMLPTACDLARCKALNR